MAAPKEKKFGQLEPQVSSFIPGDNPPDLASIDSDESRGGKNPPPVKITDENHRSFFKKEPEHTREYKYFERGKK